MVAILFAGVVGLACLLAMLSAFAAHNVKLDRERLAVVLAAAATPAGLILKLASLLGWLEVREVGSDKLFKPGDHH